MSEKIIFSDNQYRIFKGIAELTQSELKTALQNYLLKHYSQNNVFYTQEFIYAKGEIPIALVAHLDTVHRIRPTKIYFDKEEDVIWSPFGLGADDRAGVFAIVEIIKKGLRPHVIFTTDEEIGAVGAFKIASLKNVFEDLRYIIELDRRGSEDCVFYDCDNKEFEKYINSFGFKTDYGTFSDISIICPTWGVAGVNLSVGYFNEHTQVELLSSHMLLNTIKKVETMLVESEIPEFKYIPLESPYGYTFTNTNMQDEFNYFDVICSGCHKIYSVYDTIPTKSLNNQTIYFCPDCIADKVNWCERCYEAFEVDENNKTALFCKDCLKEIEKK